MFYYRITIHGGDVGRRIIFREVLRASDLGEIVASLIGARTVTSVQIAKINQAAFIRNTRPAE